MQQMRQKSGRELTEMLMANEGSTKPTYSELEAERDHNIARADAWHAKWKQSESSLARVRGLLQRQWISVEERLPEESGFYLIAFPWHFGDVSCEADYWEPAKTFRRHDGTPCTLVTHWQPLPAPPTFPQSSSLMSQAAESADIGKLDGTDKSGVEMGKVNRVDEKENL